MTKEQLISYINSLNKIEYTEDERLKIGLKMKSLPLDQRSWKWLHDFLHITEYSTDAFRHRVNRYEKSLEKMKVFADVEYRENYLEKQQIRDWYNAYIRSLRDEARIRSLKEEIQNAAKNLPCLPEIGPLPVDFPKVCVPDLYTEAILLLSDLHIGVNCDNCYNKYNAEIAAERLGRLAYKVINYISTPQIKKLHILNLGDMIAGLIHVNARVEQQMDVISQTMVASELLSKFINYIAKATSIPIDYRSVSDNHSRLVPNKEEHIEKEQLSRLIDWYLEERLRSTPVQIIKDNLDEGIGKLKVFDKTILFMHGHQDGKNNTVQNMIGLTREWVDYICMAHYHNSATKEFQGTKVFINGSIVGSEQYAFSHRLFSKPSQKLILLNQKNNDVIDIDISLED